MRAAQGGRYAVHHVTLRGNPGQTAFWPADMHAFVYKSLRKDDTYVFLAARDDFMRLPEPIRSRLGALQFVFEMGLTPERKLARGDTAVVRENLAARGFHLQLPATVLDPMTEDWGTDG